MNSYMCCPFIHELMYELFNVFRYELIFEICSGMSQQRPHRDVLSLLMETAWTSTHLEARSVYQQQRGMAKASAS